MALATKAEGLKRKTAWQNEIFSKFAMCVLDFKSISLFSTDIVIYLNVFGQLEWYWQKKGHLPISD